MWRFVFVLLLISSADCYRILGLFPYSGKSHFDVFEILMQSLAKKGHEVTVISHYPQKTSLENYTDLTFEKTGNHTINAVNVDQIPGSRVIKYLISPLSIGLLAKESCANLNSSVITDLIKSDKKFDIILVEHFNTDCFLAIVHILKTPFIGLTSHILMPWTNTRLANIDNPAYVPIHFIEYSDQMGFLERVENTFAYLVTNIFHRRILEAWDNRAVRQVFGDDFPSVSDIATNISLLLMNTHYTLNRPRPTVPGVIEIGGMHIKNKTTKLPQNIEKWITESEEGVIYFSMGSMIKGHTFPEDKRRAFLRAFGRLKQKVLWKWENETMPGKPDNVMIQRWMPQFDILCHPNVKAFISHGGLLGTTEAVHCGVPVVVMPQFGDQHTNAAALQASGGGVILNFRDADEDMVYNALKTVLDPEFNKKAKDLSERFRDRPMPPLETAIYWVEYVARHKGAHHMKTAAVGMPFYQYLLLDVAAFLLTIFLLLSYIMYFITKTILRKIFKKDKVKKS